MSLKQVHSEQPKEFKFTDENLRKAEEILKKYPKKNRNGITALFLFFFGYLFNISSASFKFSFENLNSFGCSSCTFFKLIDPPHQKLYPKNRAPPEHLLTYGHELNSPLLEDEKNLEL